jgi:hypothetical protein
MPLWGNKDYPNGNNKPLYANTSNAYSNSSINGTRANTAKFYGVVAGVSATEEVVRSPASNSSTHAGWVSMKVGTGPVTGAIISDRGQGINASGFLVITDGSVLGQGVGANISFTIANTQNTLEAYSSNARWNGIGTLTVANGGSLYSNTTSLTVRVSNVANIAQPILTITLGGRAGRIQTETLVSMGSITLDDPRDNVFFSGI